MNMNDADIPLHLNADARLLVVAGRLVSADFLLAHSFVVFSFIARFISFSGHAYLCIYPVSYEHYDCHPSLSCPH